MSPSDASGRGKKKEPASSMKASKVRRCNTSDPTPVEEEGADGDEDERAVEPEDPYMDLEALTEIARSAWTDDETGLGNIDSRSFDAASWAALPDGRLPFRIVAAALDC